MATLLVMKSKISLRKRSLGLWRLRRRKELSKRRRKAGGAGSRRGLRQ